MKLKIKTRFAPSPTGYLHVGGARSALYSWLFARKYGGKFLLRIEDTDIGRSTSKFFKSIIDSMKWLKLDWDEGPYFQTSRLDRYNLVINEMLEMRTAYKCYCPKKRLETLRAKQIQQGEKPRYDGYCRYSGKHQNENDPYVIRFANPKEGFVVFNDQIRGLITFKNQELDDLIIRRADGLPTYNFCVVIDDWDMKITHVIRGEDHINNTPRQINIIQSLKAPVPVYAHIPMINDIDKKKLSKRYGSRSVMYYRNEGYLPEALLNYLVRLGWSSGDKEIFNLEEMIKLFSLDSVSKSSSTFNEAKLTWLNHYYINSLPAEYVATHLQWHIAQENINLQNGPELSELIKLFGKRYKTLKEIVKNCRYFYEDLVSTFEKDAVKKNLCPIARKPLEMIRAKLIKVRKWTTENIHHVIQETASELQVKIGKVGMPLRVAVTGKSQTPSLDITVYTIGKNRILLRINKALDLISKQEKLKI